MFANGQSYTMERATPAGYNDHAGVALPVYAKEILIKEVNEIIWYQDTYRSKGILLRRAELLRQ